ncbi:hypothetical protein HYFRA_00007851 [Hymenoscyphus fraxineus]|uniref:Uncharacterized protein n=1 Tax=Hymenoscyphus fraxineus TaxID=746836 RepID=A0A9N9KMW6_9HELO|nr:hypothetical protein HYFRA_00007851 [Hymenoscyphus fraxineus]
MFADCGSFQLSPGRVRSLRLGYNKSEKKIEAAGCNTESQKNEHVWADLEIVTMISPKPRYGQSWWQVYTESLVDETGAP